MQRLVIMAILFAMLSDLEVYWDNPIWWCFTALFILLEMLAYSAGISAGVDVMMEMHKIKLMHLKDLYDRNANGENITLSDLDKVLNKEEKDDHE